MKAALDNIANNTNRTHGWHSNETIREAVMDLQYNYFDCAEYLEAAHGIII